jgi:hypothetical protein
LLLEVAPGTPKSQSYPKIKSPALGSVDPVVLKLTVSGALPETTLDPNTAVGAAFTLIIEALVKPPSAEVAVMVTLPADTPVTTPVLLTVARAGEEDDQVTDLLVAASGVIAALKDIVLPGFTKPVAGDTVIPVTAILPALGVMVTVDEAVNAPSTVVAVMVAVPGDTLDTSPVEETTATPVLELLHVIDLFVAFDGVTVAASVVLLPATIEVDVGETDTPVTAIFYADTPLQVLPEPST